MKDLRGIVRIWTRLTHRPSGSPGSLAITGNREPNVRIARQRHGSGQKLQTVYALLLIAVSGCGPRAHIPLRPIVLQGALALTDSGAILARSLSPVLYLQRDERFPLARVVAVLHPTKPLLAYHLLWRDDVNGSWIPFTVATDQEIIWVGYDTSGVPVDVWTYWHGVILHAPWPKAQVAINVQWGKHGSFPRGAVESDMPRFRTLNVFFAFTRLLVPDMVLSRAMRGGPATFPYDYARYREFSRVVPLVDRLDAVVRMEDPDPVLRAVFGKYSRKPNWP